MQWYCIKYLRSVPKYPIILVGTQVSETTDSLVISTGKIGGYEDTCVTKGQEESQLVFETRDQAQAKLSGMAVGRIAQIDQEIKALKEERSALFCCFPKSTGH